MSSANHLWPIFSMNAHHASTCPAVLGWNTHGLGYTPMIETLAWRCMFDVYSVTSAAMQHHVILLHCGTKCGTHSKCALLQKGAAIWQIAFFVFHETLHSCCVLLMCFCLLCQQHVWTPTACFAGLGSIDNTCGIKTVQENTFSLTVSQTLRNLCVSSTTCFTIWHCTDTHLHVRHQ